MDAQLNDAETIDAQLIDAETTDAQSIDAQTIGMDAEIMDAQQADVHLSDMGLDLGLQPRCDDELQNGNEVGVDCGGDCPACPPEFIEVIPPVYQRPYEPNEGVYNKWRRLTRMGHTRARLHPLERTGKCRG